MTGSGTARLSTQPFAPFNREALVLVWGSPYVGPRSIVLARELEIDKVHFVYLTTRRGLLAAAVKYPYQMIATLLLLLRRRPRLVIVQSPPSLAVLCARLYCLLTGSHYLIDAHSAAFQHAFWTRPAWLVRSLARQAVATLVTNEEYARLVTGWGGRAFILRDIPTDFPHLDSYPLQDEFSIAVVNTYAPDEPLPEVLEAARELPEAHFYITGKTEKAAPGLLEQAPGNVHFTGFLPDEVYYALLASSQAVMCLTTRDHTMQRGACEALSLGRPIITSDWPLLREYFHRGAVHVPNTGEGIRQGVSHLMQHYDWYREEIRKMQLEQQREWLDKLAALTGLVQQAMVAK
jgi:glycosyltransferase involved in cell wall biosynthesis